jgi:hypothetical protein
MEIKDFLKTISPQKKVVVAIRDTGEKPGQTRLTPISRQAKLGERPSVPVLRPPVVGP